MIRPRFVDAGKEIFYHNLVQETWCKSALQALGRTSARPIHPELIEQDLHVGELVIVTMVAPTQNNAARKSHCLFQMLETRPHPACSSDLVFGRDRRRWRWCFAA